MKRLFQVTVELDTDAPVDPLYHRNIPGLDLGEDALYAQLNGILECSPNLRVTSVREYVNLVTPPAGSSVADCIGGGS